MLLRDVITIPEVLSASDFVLKLDAGVERAAQTVHDYVVTPSLAESFDDALDYLSQALATNSDQGSFIHGSFGSGKSHFMAVLHLLMTSNPAARALPGLQAVVAKHESALSANVLTLDYHLIGADSLESALFSGYLRQVAALHPDATPPLLHKSDALLADAQKQRDLLGDERFFAGLASQAAGWGDFGGGWDAASYDAARSAAPGSPDRSRLEADLVSSYFGGYVQAGEWLGIEDGLQVLAQHAKSLGYRAVVFFLDELVLWLASQLGDSHFVSTEGAKVAKLVETGQGIRAVPFISYVARQRDLKDFLGDSIPGAERVAIGQTFTWWEDRFNRITLNAADLAEIAHKRLLEPSSPEGAQAIADALAAVKRNGKAWNALLTDEQGASEADFAKVFPFSPALVNTLVALSGLLQRERTALKVMAQLLVEGRDVRQVTDVIPVGDLYDVMVEGGDNPLTVEMRTHFEVARGLYRTKLRPMLLAEHGLTEADLEGSTPGAVAAGAPATVAMFFTDDRLIKTLLVAALAPGAAALRGLTASRVAHLNHGTVATPIPGAEITAVLTKVRAWAVQVGELQIGEGQDPTISLALSGVDYNSIIERVRLEDTPGARRTLLRKMVFEQLGLSVGDTLFSSHAHPVVWRGSKRTVDVVFGNIRSTDELPDDSLRASGDNWKLVIDYPFDTEEFTPNDDLARIARLRESGVTSRTVAWVPGFLTKARQDDLGDLVILEYLLAGSGDTFVQHSAHLPTDQRQLAKTMLENRRRSLRESLGSVIRMAYGAVTVDPRDIDTTFGEVSPFATLDATLTIQPVVGATLADAMANLVDQMLASQYPQHPRFEPSGMEVKRADLNTVLDHVTRAVASAGRVDPVETAKRGTMTRVANPLGVGEMLENHYVFTQAHFAWRNLFTQNASQESLSTVSMARIRAWLEPYGMARDVENLLAAAWALLDDKQWVKAGAVVQVGGVDHIDGTMELRQPVLPDATAWETARTRAAALFGATVSSLLSAANVAELGSQVRAKAGEWRTPTVDLVAELERHAATLRLDESAPRLVSARTGRDLVGRLANERDDVVLVTALADWPVPDEQQALAKSMSSAAAVTAALRGATWTVLDPVAGIAEGDPRRPRVEGVMSGLAAVARDEELHNSLVAALPVYVGQAADVLADVPRPPVIPQPGGGGGVTAPEPPSPPVAPPAPPVGLPSAVHVDDIRLDGVDDRLGEIGDQIRAALREHPERTLHVQWWLE